MKAYMEKNQLGEIKAAIALICEEKGYTTPTDVLRLCRIEETNFSRSIVLDIARDLWWCDVQPSGRGYRICAENILDDIPF